MLFDWLKIRSRRDFLIYSAGQGLNVFRIAPTNSVQNKKDMYSRNPAGTCAPLLLIRSQELITLN